MRGTIRQRAPRWLVALIWGCMLLDGGCIQAPTFPTINPPSHGMAPSVQVEAQTAVAQTKA